MSFFSEKLTIKRGVPLLRSSSALTFPNNIYRHARQPIAVSDISIYICLIDIRDGSSKPVYGGVDRLMIGTHSYAYLYNVISNT